MSARPPAISSKLSAHGSRNGKEANTGVRNKTSMRAHQGPARSSKSKIVSREDFRKAIKLENVEEVRRCLELLDSSLVNETIVDYCGTFPPLLFVIATHLYSRKSVLELVELVRVLLDHNANVNAKDQADGRTALHFAVRFPEPNQLLGRGRKRLVEVVELLLQSEYQADVNARDRDGCTPLVYARSAQMARLLIAHGADVNSKDKRGYPAWFSAIEDCDLETFKILTQDGRVDLHATWGKEGLTAIHKAAGYGGKDANLAVLEYLLDQGVDVNPKTASGKTPLHFAVWHVEALQLLLQRGADPNARDRRGEAPWTCLCKYEFPPTKMAKLLVAHGADLAQEAWRRILTNINTARQRCDVHSSWVELILKHKEIDLNAIDPANTDTLAFQMLDGVNNRWRGAEDFGPILMSLIKHGADVKARHRRSGQTLLHNAANGHFFDYNDHNYVPQIQLLLEKGSDVDAVDNQGSTPLFAACYRGKCEIVEMLINHGADVNAVDNEGRTCLLIAVSKGYWEIVEILVDYGANVNFTFGENEKASLSIACERRNKVRMVQLLLNAGAQVDYSDKTGITALLICVKRSLVTCATLLLERGANIHAGNRKGYTPFLLACKEGNLGLIYCLIRLSPRHQRLRLRSQASYSLASAVANDDSDDNMDDDDYESDDDSEDDDCMDGCDDHYYYDNDDYYDSDDIHYDDGGDNDGNPNDGNHWDYYGSDDDGAYL